ncbi:MAG: aminotransferase class III-fold pyridoxal phosphate-dependent enzyme [Cytophagales bacterium]|nr:aminotransferase class III-fold pyridoxal phosphate-dependent enzyme [Cytophagales bacterium]
MSHLSEIKILLQEGFGFLHPEIKKLNGYDNFNYLIENEGEKFIFKTYSDDPDQLTLILAENEVLAHLQNSSHSAFPSPIPFCDGRFVKQLAVTGQPTICRMLSYLEGDLLGDATPSISLYQSLGTFLANMDLQFQSITNHTIQAREWAWDIKSLYLNKELIQDISDHKNQRLVEYYFQQFEENVVPILPKLRKNIIHNDANEWNLLVSGDQVTGIIDFGDLAHSYLINELAVSIAYACYGKEDPLEWAQEIIRAYHKVLPVLEVELSVLYYLIVARLCISVCGSSHSRKLYPENTYAFSSEESIVGLMHQWITINPVEAENRFREAAGYSVVTPMSTDQMIQKRQESISPIVSLSYSQPIYMNRSAFQYMYDVYGNTYLDAYNNIPHVGHSHPKVVEAGQRQMAKLNTNTRYLYDPLGAYAEKLLSKFPPSLDKVYFVNSGSSATDLALRLAQAHTDNQQFMVMEHGYHGNTQNAIDISDYKFSNELGQGKKEHILKTPIPDEYRGKYNFDYGTAGKLYAKEAINQLRNANGAIAAFISEPIVGCGGQIPLASGYLKELYPEVRKQGGICISDEVQTGFGRLGDHFWGYEMQDVVPDIVILGKPMGNGHPIGAVITTTAIAESFGKGVEFFSSFGGNPVSCSIGLSVLNVIEKEELQKNAKEVGDYYQKLFKDLQNEHACIGDVRGSGLFIGVEIVVDPITKEPDVELANHIKNELRNQHILIGTDGPFDNVLKTKPPLCFTKENAETVVARIGQVLKNTK